MGIFFQLVSAMRYVGGRYLKSLLLEAALQTLKENKL